MASEISTSYPSIGDEFQIKKQSFLRRDVASARAAKMKDAELGHVIIDTDHSFWDTDYSWE